MNGVRRGDYGKGDRVWSMNSVTITITVSSPAWINAFDHAHGDADLAIDNVFKTLIARYEDAKLAGTYGQRNNAYARNGLRKSLWDDYERWKRGELIV